MANQIIQSIKTIAQSLVDKAGYDKTRGGVIVGVNSVTNTYSVKIDGVTYPIVRAVDDATYNVGDVVKVVIPCNQATQMYIASSVLSDNSLGNKIANAVGLAQDAKQLGLENQTEINNLDIVGINLLLNSGFKNNADEWFTYGITDYIVKDGKQCAHMNFSVFKVTNFVRQSILGKLEPDTQYTMSGWVLTENVVKGTTNFACMFYHDGYYDNNGSSKWYSYGSKNLPINAGEWTHLEWTFTTDSTKLLNSTVSDMYLYARDMTGDIYFCDLKLEKGDKATDWTPAPDDAANAAKVATNFIGYDSTNGLIIGNKTSGTWSGYHSQILPDRFNILDESSTVLASFGTTTVIGEEAKANMRLTFNNLSMLNKENSVIFEVGDLRDSSGVATLLFYSKLHTGANGVVTIDFHVNINSIVSVVVNNVTISSSEYSFDGSCITITGLEKWVFRTFEITYTTLSSVPYLTFGTRDNSGKIGYFSSIEGDNLIARGFASHAEGSCSKSTADFSHSEGYNTQANGIYSHAEGNSTVAAGDASHSEGSETKTFYAYSHAEGQLSYARGQCSHAEGFNTIAYGYMAHSEGENTEAHGNESHAEGNHTYAGGKCSHAEGYYTIAGSDYQHVSGKYNEEDYNGLYAFIIGNGTSEEEPSNAFAVDWSGNVYMSLGDCTITDSGTALSVTSGASTLDGLVAQSIIDTFSYADAKEILEA